MGKVRNAKGQFAPKNGEGKAESYFTQELISNALLSRSQLIAEFCDPRRDIDDECGYTKTESLTATYYRGMYDREAVATRVVQVMPQESWQSQPTVYETEDVDHTTPFEEAWAGVNRDLLGNNWHEDEESSMLWEYLRRADELSGIGGYGVLLLGIDDGLDLREPIEGVVKGRKLLFLRSFDESLAPITNYDRDPASPRYGQPTEYSVMLSNPGEDLKNSYYIHWSRVIHLADNLGSNEVYGVPRMQPVYNRLCDLRKLYGGSAEMYWRGAFPGLSIETHPQLGGDVSINKTKMREQMENYMNGLQRYLALTGVTAKSLAPQIVDPTPWIEVLITAICIRLGVPKRIFMGSERGELSSSQDSRTWNNRLRDRQENYLTPRVVVPFINRLITIGVLPEPESYKVVWPDLEALTEEQKAAIAVKRTEAMAKYVQGNVEALIAPMDYLTRILGMAAEEAEAVIEATMEQLATIEEEREEPVETEEEGAPQT